LQAQVASNLGYPALAGVAVKVATRPGVTAPLLAKKLNDGCPDDAADDARQNERSSRRANANRQQQNELANRIADEEGLNRQQQRQLHDEITGQNYDEETILDIAQTIKGDN
jgi:hypothetical protein